MVGNRTQRLRCRWAFFLAGCCFQATGAHAAEVVVAVAANFTAAMGEIETAFEAQSGHALTVSYGSSGRLYAQIVNGAPFQVFLSADEEKPRQLVDQGLADAATRFTYAVGSLVLWSPDADAGLDDAGALTAGRIDRLAIANPRLAPYGAAAMETLENLGLADAYRDKLVMGENISQAYQFVNTGNTDAGFVALSQVMTDGRLPRGSGWVVPQRLHSPIRQDAVVTRQGQGKPAVTEFMAFLGSDQARQIMQAFGYGAD